MKMNIPTILTLSCIILWSSSCSRVFAPEPTGTELRDLTSPRAPSLTIKERPYRFQDTEYRTFVSTPRNRTTIQEVPEVRMIKLNKTK